MGLLSGASLEPDERVAPHPALRAFDATVDKTVPLVWLVDQVYRVSKPVMMNVS